MEKDALSADHFWSSIVWTSTARLEEIAIAHDIRQSKVCNLDVESVVEQQATVDLSARISV